MQPVVAGYSTAVEPWQWLYLGLILLSAALLFLPITLFEFQRFRSATPAWMMIVGLFAMLAWFTPYGWALVLFLHLELLASTAPISASILTMLFSIGTFWLTIRTLFPGIGKYRTS